MLKRGFISRSASVVTLVGALALLSSISGVTAGTIDDSVGNAQQSPSSLVFSSASADGFSYSRWLENQGTVPASADSASTDESQADQGQAPITYGSFVLTETPLERIYGNVKDSWTQTFQNIITRAGDTSMLRGWAMDYVTGQEVDIQAGIDSWWDQRQADTTGIFVGMADVLTDNIFQAGEDQVGGFSFIRSLDWDYQTELGGRPWQLGVNAIGSLREADDDVMLWQLRGFTAKDSKGGANAGLIYRWAQEDTAMFGVNTFLDFEAHDLGDFLRWSVGGEVRTEWIDLYGNRYMAITDPRLQTGGDNDGNYAYTKDGLDLEAAFHVPDMRWVSGYIKYYLFEGQGTNPETNENNPDEKGFVYGVRVSPPMAENLRLELELDDQDGGDLDVGGRISYRHEFGGIPAGTRTAGASSFDPRDYFFDAVRREYAQRIGIYGAGGEKAFLNSSARGARMVFSSVTDGVTLNATVDINMPEYTFSRENPITIVVSEEAEVVENGVSIIVSLVRVDIAGIDGNGYGISLSDQTEISFEEMGELVYLHEGHLYIGRDGSSPVSVATPDVGIRLIGTDLRVAYVPTATETAITLYEGEISLSYDSGAKFVASVAGDAQIHDDAVNGGGETYYACNDTNRQSSDGKFIGVTSPEECALMAIVTPDPTAGTVIAAVGLPKELIHFSVSQGVGAYTFELTSNPKNYFEVDRSDADSGIFRISVVDVPESEDGEQYVIGWRVNDELEGTVHVDSGNITVLFTKAPSAAKMTRYAVAGQAYNATISVEVLGGVPDSTTGYTFSLATGSPAGYGLGQTTGDDVVLTVGTTPAEGVSFVTVGIYDSQTPPQSGNFVLEFRVVPELTFSDATLTILQTESASLLSFVSGGNNATYADDNVRTYAVISGREGFVANDNGDLTAPGSSESLGINTVTVQVVDTNPSQSADAVLVISVQYKPLPVAFDGDISRGIDPGADLPLSITLKAEGGAQFPTYSFSISEGDADWLSIEGNVLVVSTGAPASGTHSFKLKVEDSVSTEEAEAEFTFTFAKPQAQATANGNVVVSGSESADGSYTSGQTFSFDPKTEQGVTVALGAQGDTAVVVAENDKFRITLEYWTAADATEGLFFPTGGEFVFLDGKVLAQAIKDGTINGYAFENDPEADEALALKGGLVAVVAPAGVVDQQGIAIESEVSYIVCKVTTALIQCNLVSPSSSAMAFASRQLAGTVSVEIPRPATGTAVDFFQADTDLSGSSNRVAVFAVRTTYPLTRAFWDTLAEGSLFRLYSHGGTWRILEEDGSRTDIVASIDLVYPEDCTVTLPDAAVCAVTENISTSSVASAS